MSEWCYMESIVYCGLTSNPSARGGWDLAVTADGRSVPWRRWTTATTQTQLEEVGLTDKSVMFRWWNIATFRRTVASGHRHGGRCVLFPNCC